jgi:hypothetical protein
LFAKAAEVKKKLEADQVRRLSTMGAGGAALPSRR